MNFANAMGFLVTGLLLWALPVLFPGWFPPRGIDGSSARLLWAQFMGVVQGAIGLTFLVRSWLTALLASATNETPTAEETLSTTEPVVPEWSAAVPALPDNVVVVDFRGAAAPTEPDAQTAA